MPKIAVRLTRKQKAVATDPTPAAHHPELPTKFKRGATVDEFLARCKTRRFRVDTHEYDKIDGSDYIKFFFRYGKAGANQVNGWALFHTVSSRTHGEYARLDHPERAERAVRTFSTDEALDAEPWFRMILNLVNSEPIHADL